MRKILTIFLSTVAFMSVAALAMAAEPAVVNPETGRNVLDAAGLGTLAAATAIGMAIAAFGCGIGQGLGLKAACEGTARNPEAGNKITTTLILGMAFIESLAIYALVVNLILLFVRPLG